MTTGASPPVAMAVASGSVDRIRATIASTWPAVPKTSPDWIASTVLVPTTLGGATSSTRVSLAVRENRLGGAGLQARCDHPSEELPLRAHHVEVRSGAEVDDDRRSTGDREGGEGVHDAIGPDLARVVGEHRERPS